MKIDLKRELDAYRAQRDEVRFVDVPPLSYLAIDGHGDPNGPAFAEAVAALYPLAYAVKMASTRELGRDFVVMPLEGLWSADDWSSFTDARDKTRWDWTLRILQPDWVDESMLEAARARTAAKGAAARLEDVRLERLDEGRCAQTLQRRPQGRAAEAADDPPPARRARVRPRRRPRSSRSTRSPRAPRRS